MNPLIKTFNTTGYCEVHVDKVVKAWNKKFFINRYDEKYTLCKHNRGESYYLKVQISPVQAAEIISKANLLPIPDSFFKKSMTYRNKEMIISEIERFNALEKEKRQELITLTNIIRSYQTALINN